MENHKILWISLAVVGFLAIALLFAIIIIYPPLEKKHTDKPALLPTSVPRNSDPFEYLSNRTIPGFDENILNIKTEENITLVEKPLDKNTSKQDSNTTHQNKDTKTQITKIDTKKQLNPVKNDKKTEEKCHWWLQTGSYLSKTNALQDVQKLKELHFSPRIVTKTKQSKTYYRVLVGPFCKYQEAEKFMKSLRDIKQYNDCLIVKY